MTNKDQAIGGLICTTCVDLAIFYTIALFWPALEALRLWLVAIPVFIAFIAVLGIGAWIGWTMATTPPPKPIEDIQVEEMKNRKRRTRSKATLSTYVHPHKKQSQQPPTINQKQLKTAKSN